jgi:hypothetical protein
MEGLIRARSLLGALHFAGLKSEQRVGELARLISSKSVVTLW